MSLTFESLLPQSRPAPLLVIRGIDLDGITWDCLVREGHIVPLTEDVARARGVRETPALRAMALARSRPPGAAISDASAMWVHDSASGARLSGLIPSGTRVAHRKLLHRGPIRMLYTRNTPRPRASPDLEITLRRTSIIPGDVEVMVAPDGSRIPVTSPARTAIDLASRNPAREALPALHALVAQGLNLDDVTRRLQDTRRWIGRERALRTFATMREGATWNAERPALSA